MFLKITMKSNRIQIEIKQGDLDDARENHRRLMWKCKKTEFRGGNLGFLADIFD